MKCTFVSSQRNNLHVIKLTHCDETEKMDQNSLIVSAKENIKITTVGLANETYQAPTHGSKFYIMAIVESEDRHMIPIFYHMASRLRMK